MKSEQLSLIKQQAAGSVSQHEKKASNLLQVDHFLRTFANNRKHAAFAQFMEIKPIWVKYLIAHIVSEIFLFMEIGDNIYVCICKHYRHLSWTSLCLLIIWIFPRHSITNDLIPECQTSDSRSVKNFTT